MDERYEAYCFVDPLFYDSASAALPANQDFGIAGRSAPPGWSREERPSWIVLHPPDLALPSQGWKIHASSCLANADDVLAVIHDYCVAKQLAFKFLRNRLVMRAQNSKYAARGSSGKLVTIYPVNESQLERTLTELGELLDGQPGPYILSDLRWNEGPLYVRYGGFAERFCRSGNGDELLAIEDPDGHLVPDLRGPVFALPSWVSLPVFLRPHLAARSAATLAGFPFEIEEVLHFSNGGGVYLATDTATGRQVVVKEARPHAGLDGAGTDAMSRLRCEHDSLMRLAGTGVAPTVLDFRRCWEHQFLTLEHVAGEQLNRAFAERYPLVRPEPDNAELAAYTKWALDISDQLGTAVRTVHEGGVVHGDLHPRNVLIRPDGRLALIDFEIAAVADSAAKRPLGAFGFSAPAEYQGFAIDEYALACLRLWLFLPLTALLRLDPPKAEELIAAVAGRFPVPQQYLGQIRAGLGQPKVRWPRSPRWRRLNAALAAEKADWPTLRDSMVRGITASATPRRADRLFPGDINQFITGGLGVAYGAAGVLWALQTAGAGRFPEYEEWLLAASQRTSPQPGFYLGTHGIAYVFERLGRAEDAASLLDRAAGMPCDLADTSLLSGLAGTGLTFLHFARVTGDAACYQAALEAADRIARALRQRPGADHHRSQARDADQPGLMRGASGAAMLFVRLYEHGGDSQFLDLALAALRVDLNRCVWCPDGTLQTDDVFRVLPYVAMGSAGIGLVLRDYLRHRPDPELAVSAAAIQRAAEPELVSQSGLFMGRAGLLAHLSRLRDLAAVGSQSHSHLSQVIARHLARLSWHAVPFQGDIAFPGEHSARLSADLATGSAGVLVAIQAALRSGPVLPFLDDTPTAPEPAQATEGR
jgi:tRNA A-37 threonylcarbamoyl transferase component Bud32